MSQPYAGIVLLTVVLAATGGCSSQSQTTSPLEPTTTTGGSFVPPASDAPRIGTMATIVDVPISISNTDGTVGTWNWVGQSITLPAGNTFSDIKFSWYHSNPRGTPTAFGRLYVLDRPYFGPPIDLNSSTLGVLGVSDQQVSGISSGQGIEYTLPATLTLTGGTQYWFYTDAQGAFATSFDQDVYAGGQMFLSGTPKLAFHESKASGRMVNGVFVPAPPNVTTDANFRLRGIAR